MKRAFAFVLAALMLLACGQALAVRPIEGPGQGGGGDIPHRPGLIPWPPAGPANPGSPVDFAAFIVPDTDFDGVPDYADGMVKSNTFASTVYHTKPSYDIDTSYPYTYTWDYRWLLAEPSQYNAELCRLSSLLGGLGYHRNAEDPAVSSDDLYTVSNSLGSYMNLPAFMRAHGMEVTEYNLNSYYNDNHLTLASLGIHTVVTEDGASHDVVLVALRGSNATWAEWNSNFEIGHDIANCDPDFLPQKFGVNPDWTNSENHMGFDVAASRLLRMVEQFTAEHGTGAEVTYWVTGHSRGAAIANLLEAKLCDRGARVFGYNFACPNTTLSSNTAAYHSIFNLVNEDDLVSYLPFSDWGYRRYGRTARIDMSSAMQSEWADMMGEGYDHAETTLTNAVNTMKGIASDRNDCYTYTCACHGDGSDTSIKTDNWYLTRANREKGIAKTPACLTGYYKLELEDATLYWTHHCQPPVFFMQYLACYMAGQMTMLEFADYDVADRYESAKWALAPAAIVGVEHPHYCESYFIIADHVLEGLFVY